MLLHPGIGVEVGDTTFSNWKEVTSYQWAKHMEKQKYIHFHKWHNPQPDSSEGLFHSCELYGNLDTSCVDLIGC